jgi:hypothetical protein
MLTTLHRALRIQQSPVRRKVVADRGFRGGDYFGRHDDNLLDDWKNSQECRYEDSLAALLVRLYQRPTPHAYIGKH